MREKELKSKLMGLIQFLNTSSQKEGNEKFNDGIQYCIGAISAHFGISLDEVQEMLGLAKEA